MGFDAGRSASSHMAKKKTKKKTSSGAPVAVPGGRSSAAASDKDAQGKHLVIVESARTINRYLGPVPRVGHVRDLPPRPPKGVKRVVPLRRRRPRKRFEPAYEVTTDKKLAVTDLREPPRTPPTSTSPPTSREGEAIAPPRQGPGHRARPHASCSTPSPSPSSPAPEHPRTIETHRVDAQQADASGSTASRLPSPLCSGRSHRRRSSPPDASSPSPPDSSSNANARSRPSPPEFWKITGLFATDAPRGRDLAEQMGPVDRHRRGQPTNPQRSERLAQRPRLPPFRPSSSSRASRKVDNP